MSLLAAITRPRRSWLSVRAIVTLCIMSLGIPRLWTRSKGIRHRGQGHLPRFRMLAIKILEERRKTLLESAHFMRLNLLTSQGSRQNRWISLGKIDAVFHRSTWAQFHAPKRARSRHPVEFSIVHAEVPDDNVWKMLSLESFLLLSVKMQIL